MDDAPRGLPEEEVDAAALAAAATTTTPPSGAGAGETPFNEKNVLLCEKHISDLFCRTGVSGLPVRDINVYRKALTHRSYCTRKNENFLEGNIGCPAGCLPLQEESNERLEFLGDAILGAVVAAYLFERYPDEYEGFLTRMRSKIVNGVMLSELCKTAGLAQFIIMSRQYEDHGGRRNRKVLEDCFEAFIGALFVDAGPHGYTAAQAWLVAFMEQNIDFTALVTAPHNYKDALYKHFQHAFNYPPRFHACDPAETSVIVVDKENAVLGKGTGPTRKAAENEAARRALCYLGQYPG